MGPTTAALLKLFRADQAYREARARLEAVTRDVRLQDQRNAATVAKLQAGQLRLRELQAKSANFDLDLKIREEHIEKLREQQQLARNNKEYQAFLVEINTAKVDRAKVEELAIKTMEQVETATAEVAAFTASAATDSAKLEEMKVQVGGRAAEVQAEIDRLKPDRDEAASQIKPNLVEQYDKLADRYDGEGMAAIEQPNPREEEYMCSGCNMGVVRDVYNKLKTRDDVVTCPSCRRILFVPPSMSAETTTTKKTKGGKSERKVVKLAKSVDQAAPENKWQSLIAGAQGESVGDSADADQKPVDCIVRINGEVVGTFKGKSAEHLERVIRFRMEENKLSAEVKVSPMAAPEALAPEVASEPAV